MLVFALSASIVALTGLFFLTLAGLALFVPARAKRFLLGFATSPTAHYLELLLRIVIGAACVGFATHAPTPWVFTGFGWVLLLTSVGLLLLPWRWHQRFAQRSVPQALAFLPWIGMVSVLMGGFVLWSVWRAAT